jgi:uncharacterized protein YdeI (YjbR/CyaY-like superfamily)
MIMKRPASLKRVLHAMPKRIRELLDKKGLMKAYNARPPYQRNDYIGWILGAKQEATREKRVNQMLSELRKGTHYMRMAWTPRKSK